MASVTGNMPVTTRCHLEWRTCRGKGERALLPAPVRPSQGKVFHGEASPVAEPDMAPVNQCLAPTIKALPLT